MKKRAYNKKKQSSFSAKNRQLRYLSQSARLEEALHPRLVYATVVCIAVTVVSFFVWAGITNIREVARVPGEVVPRGFQQVVQHYDGGIIRSIDVTEGTIVEAGDILITLEGSGTAQDLRRVRKQQIVLLLQRERLRAAIAQREPDFSSIPHAPEELIAEQNAIFAAMMEARARERDIINDLIQQKKLAIAVLESRRSTAAKNVNLMQDMHNRREDLHQRGYVSHIGYLQTQRELNAGRGELAAIAREIDMARASLQEYDMRLAAQDAGNQDENYKALEQVEAQIAQNEEAISKAADRFARQDVRAPVRGIVKGLSVNTIGGVVQPGQALMEIVPMDENLVVELRISPRHIGPVKPGQGVLVKVSSYDFSRYGVVAGTLESISATTFLGEGGDRFYRGRVALDSSFIGQGASAQPLLPGMTVMADIVTGDKTVLDYLLKPIHRAMLSSFSER